MIDVSVRYRVNKRGLLNLPIFFLIMWFFFIYFWYSKWNPVNQSINQPINQLFDQVKPFRVIYQGHIKTCLLRPSEDTFYNEMVGLLLNRVWFLFPYRIWRWLIKGTLCAVECGKASDLCIHWHAGHQFDAVLHVLSENPWRQITQSDFRVCHPYSWWQNHTIKRTMHDIQYNSTV